MLLPPLMVQADSALRGDFCALVLDEAEMSSPYPNMRHRDILQKLMQAEWTPHQRLAPAGDGILGTMLGKGWIERRVADRGIVNYRITDQGKEAFRAPMPLR
jgi:hypothetical protein